MDPCVDVEVTKGSALESAAMSYSDFGLGTALGCAKAFAQSEIASRVDLKGPGNFLETAFGSALEVKFAFDRATTRAAGVPGFAEQAASGLFRSPTRNADRRASADTHLGTDRADTF